MCLIAACLLLHSRTSCCSASLPGVRALCARRCWRAWQARMLLAAQGRQLPGAWQQLQPQAGRPPEARRVCKQVPLRLRASILLCRRQPPGSASAACCARPSLHALYVHTCSVKLLLGGCLLPIKGCLSVGESQAATYAHLPAGKSAQGASIGHAALAALPADSAMKALVEHLAGSSSAAGTSPWPSALLTSIP